MNPFQNKIYTASAGTGKTYKLSMEYLNIVLNYYQNPEVEGFQLDNILVLTFTRKATAEIRERIETHLKLLCSTDPDKSKDKQAILDSLKQLNQGRDPDKDWGKKLESALRTIASDRRQLQVMTIDAYINGIFRNIVRPLRSIDKFDIDLAAVEKRLPYLLKHMMGEEFEAKLNSLLRRKVRPSLDEYRNLIASMIGERWLYYQICKDKHSEATDPGQLRYQRKHQSPAETACRKEEFDAALAEFLNLLMAALPQAVPETLFITEFRKLLAPFPEDFHGLLDRLTGLCSQPEGAYQLFGILQKRSLLDGNKFKKKEQAEAKAALITCQEGLRGTLANYLVHSLLLVEQEEIIEVWEAVLAEYDKLIYLYKNMTYDDVSWFTLEALFSDDPPRFDLSRENVATEFYQFLSHRSRFILIDEFQDTSLMQFAILKPIIEEVTAGQGTKDFGGVIVVGDDKQSIFSWRGGERKLLQNLGAIFPNLAGVKPENLKVSYRSSPAMVEFVNSVFGHPTIGVLTEGEDKGWKYEPISSSLDGVKPEEYPVTVLEFKTAAYSYTDPDNSLRQVYQDFVKKSLLPVWKEYDRQLSEPGKAGEIAVLGRKGKELDELQQIMDTCGITSIYQPSSLLPDHPLISPLIAWLRWLAFRDPLDFLQVLRSDLILLLAAPFKAVADALAADPQGMPDLAFCPLADSLYRQAGAGLYTPSQACRRLLDLCLTERDTGERDARNLQAFLDLIANFELDRAERDKSIPAFLDWLEDNRQQEFMKQVSVEGKGRVQLLTIHKSKGLQFDKVFVFYNLSGQSGNDYGSLKCLAEYAGADFQSLKDFALTFHYPDLLKFSDYSNLVETEAIRELMEELNTLYVAFTRAKTELHVCFAYRGSKTWEDHIAVKPGEIGQLPTLVCDAALAFFKEKGVEPADGRYVYTTGLATADRKDEDKLKQEGITADNLAAALPPLATDPFAGCEPNPDDHQQNWKKAWLEDRYNLKGNLIHYYLSFLKRDREEEHVQAARQTLAAYGSILSQPEILDLINNAKTRLSKYPQLFDPHYDKVFTEFTLWWNGRELRIDRLMLDTANRKALILDYKSGSTREQSQLETYVNAVKSLEEIARQGYTVTAEFIAI